jgi:OOP family OmpA-OmpF porin
MAASIIDNVRQLISQNIVSNIADRLGENPDNVSRGLHAGSMSILGGLANKTDDTDTMSRVFDLISKPGAGVGALADDVALAREGKAPTELADLSSRFLSDLFGDRAPAVNAVVGEASGLKGESISSIMRFAAPIVLGFLGRHVRTSGLDLTSFRQMLSNERNNIMRAAPPGLAAALGTGPRETREQEVPFQFDRRDLTGDTVPIHEPSQPRSSSRWMWPALATLAVLAIIWGVRRSHRAATIDTTSVAGGEVAAPAIAPPASTMGRPGSITLPNGTTLAVPAGGVETRFVAFISDSSRHPSDSSFFDFDRLMFATNSPNLLPQSDEQLASVAKILAAYPNVKVKIAGYTDNVGSPAANQRLSAQRAEAVKTALIKDGASASQLTSEGYGEKNPEADNSTETGRVQNRRVALIVLRK